jgi:hypothetical protein
LNIVFPALWTVQFLLLPVDALLLVQPFALLSNSGVGTDLARGMDALLVSPKIDSAKASGPELLEPLGWVLPSNQNF